jgi:hypothetical protein
LNEQHISPITAAMDLINQGAQLLRDGITYLQENAWYIVIMLGVGYYVKMNCECVLELMMKIFYGETNDS